MISNNKRDDLQIARELLLLATTGIKKTRLMYQTNLCYTHFMKYLNFLLEKQFLIEKMGNPGKLYYTTEKGQKLVDEVNNVIELMR